jgi:two-component system cell cycle response regulator CpdR
MARILIAENNDTVSAYLLAALKKGGHKIDVASNSLDAWRAIGTGGYDALLVNVVMPGVDGFVLAQKAIAENHNTQIIFITGFAAVAMDSRGTPAYAPAPFTSRPFHLSQISRRLGALMHGGFYEAASEQSTGTVIYADFAARKMAQGVEA